MRRLISGFALALAAAMAVGGARADELDGSAPAICVATDTYDCAPGDECIRDTPEAVNLPRFIRLDFAAKKAFTKRADGEERTAEIRTQQAEEGRLILQGIQAGHGWSMAITQATGAMSLAITGDELGIVIFGVCTTL